MLGSSPTQRIADSPRVLATAAGLYAILAVIASWPLVLHFHDQVPGSELWRTRTIHSESLVNLDAVVVHPTPLGSALQSVVEDALTVHRRERFEDGTLLLWVRQP